MTSNQRYEVILGALLHDIGKFYQRASPSEEVLSEVSRQMENMLCPVVQGRYSHRHVLFTSEFCDRHLENLPSNLDKNSIVNFASYHHRPDSKMQEIIQKADVLSSAMEREVDEDYVGGSTAYRRVRLRSVMSEVKIKSPATKEKDTRWVHNLIELDPERAFPFAASGSEDDRDLTGEYKQLWDRFIAAWSKNRVTDPWGFTKRALTILERFTWCIPSATNVLPDISLFDHMKTTAAIASCLYEAADTSEPFLLVVTDFAGIQNYIYSIRSGAGGLARRLRARSFSVTLMGDGLIHKILRDLELPLTNCLISSGGKSYLLLPNTEKSRKIIESVKNEMDSWSLRKTHGEVRINAAMISSSYSGLRDFSLSLDQVSSALWEAKSRPLLSCLQHSGRWVAFEDLIDHLEIPEDGGLCDSCQKHGGPMRQVRDKLVPICDRCHEDQEVGRLLTRSKFIAFYEKGNGRFALPFGSYDLLSSANALQGEPYLVLCLQEYPDLPGNIPLTAVFRSRYVPHHEDGDIKTFEELADAAQGRKSLAYLKSDVDNLGFIFGYGFKHGGGSDLTSISRLTTLSRSLDLFFSGYFDYLLAKEYPDIYTVYSGGDDLLCLGPWDKVIDLASRVREKFRLYTCGSPSWTISTGIALAGPKTPVLTSVGYVDRLLDASKEIQGTDIIPWPGEGASGATTKDRITVFGTSSPWEHYSGLMQKGQWLSRLLKDGKINTSRIRRLLRYAEMFRDFQRTGDTRNLKYIYLLSYDIRRNWDPVRATGDDEALMWVQSLVIPDSPEMRKLRFICEYALNQARGREENHG